MEYEVRLTANFETGLDGLADPIAQRAVAIRLTQVASGLFGDFKLVGKNVSELRIDVGKGYRAYFTIKEQTIVIMLCGGSKKTQYKDIKRAEEIAADL